MSPDEREEAFERLFGKAMRETTGPLRYKESKELVPVPSDLREFLLEVHHRIEERDETATIPSDDLLQCERAYGGLDDDSHRYSFVYFPGRGNHVRWEFKLLPSEIHEIGSGGSEKLTVRRFEKE